MNIAEFWDKLFDLNTTIELLNYDFVQHALLAAAILGLVSGALAPMVVARNMAFAVHGTAELAFTGAAAALLLGLSIGAGALVGSVVAALLLGLLSYKATERDSVIGAVLSFGLGLGVLLLALNPGRTKNKFSLLVGQIVGVDGNDLLLLSGTAIMVLLVFAIIYRPLLFASADEEIAAARGIPIRLLTLIFAVLVGVATALGVQTVGALLVLALMVAPGAAATRLTASPLKATMFSILFAEIAVVGGILLSLAPGLPVSAFISMISFIIYLLCRVLGSLRRPQRLTSVSAG